MIFRPKSQLAGGIHIEKLGAGILKHAADLQRNIKQRQVADVLSIQINRAGIRSLMVVGDQAIKQPGHRRFPTAGSPAEQNKRTILNGAGNMLQSASGLPLAVRQTAGRIRKGHILTFNHFLHPLAAST